MRFRPCKQLLDGCCRPGAPRRQCHPWALRLRAADEEGWVRGLRTSQRQGACARAIAPIWGHSLTCSRARAGAGSGRDTTPEGSPTVLSSHGRDSPPCRQQACGAEVHGGRVRSGTERRLCAAPTLARALPESADPKPKPFRCQRAAGCVAPRTGTTGQAAPSFPHLAWPV